MGAKVPKNPAFSTRASWEVVYLGWGFGMDIFLRIEFGIGLERNASWMVLSWF